MKKILVTGASGFIGNNLCQKLTKLNRDVIGSFRNRDIDSNNKFKKIFVGNIGKDIDWSNALKDIDCIIHCAGKAITMNKKNELDTFSLINVEGTKIIAEQAVKAGVKRFIFLSSIKVNGEGFYSMQDDKIYNNRDRPKPKDPYAISKFEAEKILSEISNKMGLEVVILRVPLVYGFGAKGNLYQLMKLINYNLPLPFSLIKNKRSLIGIDNLIDLLIRCTDHQEASGKTFLASDGEDLSTPELIKLIASSMKRKANLFPFPISMLKFLASVFGRREEINRLVGSLRVDNSYTKEILNWTPPVSVEEGIRRMVQGK